MIDPLIKKKALEAKKLSNKFHSIPESKYKQRAVIKSKINIIMKEIQDLKRYNNEDAHRKDVIKELDAIYATGRMMFPNLPGRWRKYTTKELEIHLAKCKERIKDGRRY